MRTQNRTLTRNGHSERVLRMPISPRIGRDSNSRYAFTYTHFPDAQPKAPESDSPRRKSHLSRESCALRDDRSIVGAAREIVHGPYTARSVPRATSPFALAGAE